MTYILNFNNLCQMAGIDGHKSVLNGQINNLWKDCI